ncbi:MAG: hypothetical protein ACXAC7_01435, partial [Candidatus Hodarchaeales archaeon]
MTNQTRNINENNIKTPMQLASAMTKIAIRIRNQTNKILNSKSFDNSIYQLFENSESYLNRNFKINDFSDIYAQTVTFCLFTLVLKKIKVNEFYNEISANYYINPI